MIMKIECLLFAVILLSASPLAARMIGGPDCKQSKVKLDEKSLELDYYLDCGNEQADVSELPDPFSTGARLLAVKVRQHDNSNVYGIAVLSGKSGIVVMAEKGHHLPQGSEGLGQGQVKMLGQVWSCNRAPVLPDAPAEYRERFAGMTEADCELLQ